MRMYHIFGLQPSSRRGWKFHSKYKGRKQMVIMLRKLKQQREQVVPVKSGGISADFPYSIYIKVKQ